MRLLPEQATIALADLRLLAALGETRSLPRAAKRLQVNHTSAWRRLGSLEARLGVRLFERERSGYLPTAAGEEAIAGARRALGEIDVLERRLKGQDVRAGGVVRLTFPETLLELVMPILTGLRATHPSIMVEAATSNAFFTLTRRDADIALRPAKEAPEGLVARRVGDVASAIYASPGYLATRIGDDIFGLDWLAPDDSLSHLASARWLAANVSPAQVVHRASSLTVLRAAARAGMGVAPLPCFLGDGDADLVRLVPPLPEMATKLWLLTHPDLRHTVRVRVVLEAIVSGLARAQKALGGESRSG